MCIRDRQAKASGEGAQGLRREPWAIEKSELLLAAVKAPDEKGECPLLGKTVARWSQRFKQNCG
eukprot:14691694-Alexandrium_andersonii.AAC.1